MLIMEQPRWSFKNFQDKNWNLNKPLDIRLIQPNIVEIAVSRIACNISALIYRKQGIFTLC